MTIHTIGDSHSRDPWNKVPNTIVNWLGPKLCYTVTQRDISFLKFRRPIKDNDTLVFCFGEIDCRAHIHKHITKENTYKKQIDSITNSYVSKIQEKVKTIESKVTVAVFNVPPPPRDCDVKQNPNYPHVGTQEERRKYAKYFNKQLEKLCAHHGFVFVDVYDKHADSQGYSLVEEGDPVHIKNPEHVIEFLKTRNIQ